MKLIMTKGLPASGKTTWAKTYLLTMKSPTKRINKDDLRAMLDDGSWSKKNESFILEVRNSIITDAFNNGFDVIVDDTNLSPKHEKDLKDLADRWGATFEVKDFTYVPLSTCLERDAKRPNPVGSEVIIKMWTQFVRGFYRHNPQLYKAIIVDLDGTLALFPGKDPYNRNFLEDIVNTPVADVVRGVHAAGSRVLIFSGRSDKYYLDTAEWLHKNSIPYETLAMRRAGDQRDDAIVKEEFFNEHAKDFYDIQFVLDDRDKVVFLWRKLGLTCFQVDYGNF